MCMHVTCIHISLWYDKVYDFLNEVLKLLAPRCGWHSGFRRCSSKQPQALKPPNPSEQVQLSFL